MNSATAMIGRENSSKNATTVDIHTNTGIRRRRMPFARMLRTVTMKLTDEISEARPMICRPSAQ